MNISYTKTENNRTSMMSLSSLKQITVACSCRIILNICYNDVGFIEHPFIAVVDGKASGGTVSIPSGRIECSSGSSFLAGIYPFGFTAAEKVARTK